MRLALEMIGAIQTTKQHFSRSENNLETINDCIKGKDLAARIGGEKVAILLPETPFEGATTLAENLRRAPYLKASWESLNVLRISNRL